MTQKEAISQIERNARLYPFDSVWLVRRKSGYVVLSWPGTQPQNATHYFNGKPV